MTIESKPLQTVLVGTSLEAESDQVVRAGLAVARAVGGRVHLAHAAPYEPALVGFGMTAGADFDGEQVSWRQEKLREQIRRLGVQEAELAGTTVEVGVPHRLLLEAARTSQAGLIVVGATEAGPLGAELLGSTADRVLQKSTCPVLVVRGDLPVPPRSVMAAVDLSELSDDSFRAGLGLVGQLAKGGETGLRVVYALGFMDSLALEHQKVAGNRDEAERHAAEELRKYVQESRAAEPFQVETAVLNGEARFEILRELNERPVDLVVLGTHGRGGWDRLVLGSVASTVARKAPCSVLLTSPRTALTEGH